MNSAQLQCVLSNDRVSRHHATLVCASDQLPNRVVTYPYGLILNTQESSRPGKHWVSIWIQSDQKSEFFDSFGLGPSTYGFDTFLQRVSKRYSYNGEVLQSANSDTCGLYALFYILLKVRDYQMSDILNYFSKDDTLMNDLFLYRFALNYFNQCL